MVVSDQHRPSLRHTRGPCMAGSIQARLRPTRGWGCIDGRGPCRQVRFRFDSHRLRWHRRARCRVYLERLAEPIEGTCLPDVSSGGLRIESDPRTRRTNHEHKNRRSLQRRLPRV